MWNRNQIELNSNQSIAIVLECASNHCGKRLQSIFLVLLLYTVRVVRDLRALLLFADCVCMCVFVSDVG